MEVEKWVEKHWNHSVVDILSLQVLACRWLAGVPGKISKPPPCSLFCSQVGVLSLELGAGCKQGLVESPV